MGTLANRYWIQTDGRARLYVYYAWEEPWILLSYSGLDAAGNTIAGRYQLDGETGKISGLTLYRGTAAPSGVEATDQSFIETGITRNAEVRQTFRTVGRGEFEVTTETYRKGAWKPGKSLRFIQVSKDLIASLGWIPVTAMERPKSFLSGLGEAMKQGAIAGLNEGVRDGVHDRTQSGIAGKYTQPKVVSTPPQ